MDSIQVFDGFGGLPPEVIAIVEENKKLKEKIVSLEKIIDQIQETMKSDKSKKEEKWVKVNPSNGSSWGSSWSDFLNGNGH